MPIITRYMHDAIELAVIQSQAAGDYVAVSLLGEDATLHASKPNDRGYFTVHINGYDMGTFHVDSHGFGKTVAHRVGLGLHIEREVV